MSRISLQSSSAHCFITMWLAGQNVELNVAREPLYVEEWLHWDSGTTVDWHLRQVTLCDRHQIVLVVDQEGHLIVFSLIQVNHIFVNEIVHSHHHYSQPLITPLKALSFKDSVNSTSTIVKKATLVTIVLTILRRNNIQCTHRIYTRTADL